MPSMKSLGMISIVVTLLLIIFPLETLSASNEVFNLPSYADVSNQAESLNSSTDLNFTGITLFAVVRGGTKYAEQDNQPLFSVSVPPSPGNPWDWQVSGLTGFAPTGNITFTYADDGPGQPNELHTEATMTWSGFQDSEWASGADGSFTLTLTNGVDPDRIYTIDLSLRSLPSISFTVLEGQDQAETDPICAAPAEGPYNWSATGVSGIVPAPTISFTFDGGDTVQSDGRVSVTFAGDWSNQNGTFTLTMSDGSRPDSVFDGSRGGTSSQPKLSLRKLVGDGYTMIAGQTSGGDGVSAAGAEGFSFSPSGYSGLAPAPTTLDFNAMGAVTNAVCANWNQDGTFTLTVTDGTRPGSIFNSRTLSLRQLISDGYTLIDGQTSGSDGINAAGAHGFTFTASGYAGLSPAPTTLNFNAMGAVTAVSVANWNQDGTFTLTVQDGTRPESVITGRALSLRKLISDGYSLIDGQTWGGDGINAAGAHGFVFTASGYAGLSPAPAALDFNAMGVVTNIAVTNWNQDGTFTLTVTDGTRPGSIFNSRALSLRQLIGDGYTLIDGQTSGSDGINAAGAHGFTFTASGYAGLSPAPTTLNFNAMGAVTAVSVANWNQDGTFTLTVQDGSRPESVITGCALSLRALIGDGYTIFEGHTPGDGGVNAPGVYGFTVVADQFDWGSSPTPTSSSLTFNENAVVIGYAFADATWTEDGTFRMRLTDGPRPTSTISEVPIRLRQRRSPVDFDGDDRSEVVVFRAGAWRFFDYDTASFDHGLWTGTAPGCIPAPMDYDGDGGVEPTQLCGGAWHFYNDDGTYNKGIWTGGVAGDLPVPADYDGDATEEVVVWRAGAWRFFDFTTATFDHGVWTGSPAHWLGGTNIPVPMDYDGDGAAEFTVFSGGPWHFYNDDGTYNKGIWTGGVAGDLPVPADYNGDITEEAVVWRGGAWRFFDFATAAFDHGVWTGSPPHWLGATSLPSPLDVDGDSDVDFTVFSGGPWHFYDDAGGYTKGIWTGGVAGDLPLSRRLLP